MNGKNEQSSYTETVPVHKKTIEVFVGIILFHKYQGKYRYKKCLCLYFLKLKYQY